MASTPSSVISDANTNSIGRLRCSFSDPANDDAGADPSSFLWFRPNQGKRSSFVLDLPKKTSDSTATPEPTFHIIEASPCQCYVDFVAETTTTSNRDSNFFFLGGFQLISTARSIEVYVMKKGSNEEELLMTCRGIPVRDKDSNNGTSDCFKVFSVVPGGPRPVHQLRLQLANADSSVTRTKLVSIQLTGRIPDRPNQKHSHPHQQSPIPQMTPPSAKRMQQMMMAAAAAGNTTSAGFLSATPIASGSTPRNPFFTPASSPPPMAPPFPINHAAAAAQTIPTSNSFASPSIPGSTVSSSANDHSNLSAEAIVAGVSFLVRSEGQTTVQLLQNELQKNQIAVDHKLQTMEQKLQQQQAMMAAMMQQQQTMMIMLQQYQQQQQHLHLQWMAMSSEEQQPQTPQKQPQYVEQQEQHEFVELHGELAGNSPHNEFDDQFPMESTYDPTCRVPLPDPTEDTKEETTEAQISTREKMEEAPDPPSARDKKQDAPQGNDDAGQPNDDKSKALAIEVDPEDEEANNEEETKTVDDADAIRVHSKDDNDDDDDDKDTIGGSPGLGGDRRTQNAAQESSRSSKDPSPRGGHGETSKPEGKEADTMEGSELPQGKEETTLETLIYNADDDSKGNTVCDSIMQKHLVFAAPPFLFPTNMGPSASHDDLVGDTAMGAKDDEVPDEFPSIEKKVSMVDHLSIRYCSTGITEIPSLPSQNTMTFTGHHDDEIDQADSIEVLAVFPTSPSGLGVESPESTPSSKSSSQLSSPSYDDGDIDDENPSDTSDEGYDSQEIDDLVSVSLLENIENKQPLVSILKNGAGSKELKTKELSRTQPSRSSQTHLFY